MNKTAHFLLNQHANNFKIIKKIKFKKKENRQTVESKT